MHLSIHNFEFVMVNAKIKLYAVIDYFQTDSPYLLQHHFLVNYSSL